MEESIYILNASLSLVFLFIIIFYHIVTLSDLFRELISFVNNVIVLSVSGIEIGFDENNLIFYNWSTDLLYFFFMHEKNTFRAKNRFFPRHFSLNFIILTIDCSGVKEMELKN